MDGARVITKAATSRRQQPPVEVVSFCGRRPAKKITVDQSNGENPQSATRPVEPAERKQFNLKRARFEVSQLCMKSLKDTSKVQAKEALAIALGAKPNKNKGINYKVLQAQRQQERDSQQEAEKLQGLGKVLKKTGRRNSSGKALGRPQSSKSKPKSTPSANKAPKKLQKGILGQYGKVNKSKIRAAKKK